MPKRKKLTPLGSFLAERSVNKSDVARKVGISNTRLNRLCYDDKSYLRAYELQLIALAINVNPSEMQKELFGHLRIDHKQTPHEQVIAKLNYQLNFGEKIPRYNISLRELERISSMLLYCIKERSELEILTHLNLKRRSPQFTIALKSCVDKGWLIPRVEIINESRSKFYKSSEEAKNIIEPINED